MIQNKQDHVQDHVTQNPNQNHFDHGSDTTTLDFKKWLLPLPFPVSRKLLCEPTIIIDSGSQLSKQSFRVDARIRFPSGVPKVVGSLANEQRKQRMNNKSAEAMIVSLHWIDHSRHGNNVTDTVHAFQRVGNVVITPRAFGQSWKHRPARSSPELAIPTIQELIYLAKSCILCSIGK